MANEIQGRGPGAGRTCYFQVRNSTSGFIWNGTSFESYLSGTVGNYDTAMVEQGLANYYVGNFPASIPAGIYAVEAKQQVGGSPAEGDPTWGTQDFNWNGSIAVPLSDLATSGQVGLGFPIRLARGTQILNFGFKMVSSADHVTPLTSGVISGRIARDGGAFGVLQSGAFTEIGLGWYNLQALTSGDLLANTAKLAFTGTGISGGLADQRDFFFILNRTSGQ